MPHPPRPSLRRYPDAVRHRLEVAAAVAWEALVKAHTRHALQFVMLVADRIPFDEAVIRYLRETGVPAQMAVSIQTRVLVGLEEADARGALSLVPPALEPESEPAGVQHGDRWHRFRPDIVLGRVRRRQHRHEETERRIQLGIARAEEGIMRTHIENAAAIAGLLEPYTSLTRAVEEYVGLMELTGGRAQAVFQRTMARLAEVYLPPPEPVPSGPRSVRSLHSESS